MQKNASWTLIPDILEIRLLLNGLSPTEIYNGTMGNAYPSSLELGMSRPKNWAVQNLNIWPVKKPKNLMG